MSGKKYYIIRDHNGPGWFVCGPSIRLGFEDKVWADIICRFINGEYNSAKGIMVELEKRNNVDPMDGRTKGKKG